MVRDYIVGSSTFKIRSLIGIKELRDEMPDNKYLYASSTSHSYEAETTARGLLSRIFFGEGLQDGTNH